ncbi:GGDEF domain-containing protein [Shewanella psychropiezotolerans]|uniref:diguanylate cyclase n=2 Tax=Shewanella psychropiezotolerans TaxID=2593655 RepID=A0ABX5WWA7_9GAMM|nr:GGDEF domain-containing protein [Shewanella psychropiezotolerans]
MYQGQFLCSSNRIMSCKIFTVLIINRLFSAELESTMSNIKMITRVIRIYEITFKKIDGVVSVFNMRELFLASIFMMISGVFSVFPTKALAEFSGNKKITQLEVTNVSPEYLDKALLKLEHIRTQQPEVVIDQLKTLSSFTSIMSQEQVYRYSLLRAHSYALSGKSEMAISLLNEQLASPFNTGLIKYKSRFLYLLANTYSHYNHYAKSLQTLHQLLPLLAEVDDIESEVYGYTLAIELLVQMNLNNEALKYAKILHKKLPNMSEARHRCFTTFSYAESLNAVFKDQVGYGTKIIDMYQDAFDECSLANEKMVMAGSLIGLGKITMQLDKLTEARLILKQALELSSSIPYPLDIADINMALAKVDMGEAKYKQALSRLNEVSELISSLKDKQLLASFYLILSEVNENLANIDAALTNRKLYLQNYLTDLGETQSKIIAFETTKLNYIEKERQIRYLNKDRELYTAKATLTELQRRNERLMNTFVFGGLVLLAIFALVMTMQKRKYKQLAQHDALTGIFNRGTAQNIAENSYIKTASKRGMFSVIMFDLDYFKRINDNYGHGTGDWVLKKVAEVINKISRSDDIFARFGGEEFALFLPGTDEAKANAMAEEYRSLIQSIETRFSGHNFNITASFGVSTSSEDDLSLDPLLHRADIAMYHSKEQGRNCVTLYKPEIEQSRSGYQKSKMALG